MSSHFACDVPQRVTASSKVLRLRGIYCRRMNSPFAGPSNDVRCTNPSGPHQILDCLKAMRVVLEVHPDPIKALQTR
jgi:hypothetical protein